MTDRITIVTALDKIFRECCDSIAVKYEVVSQESDHKVYLVDFEFPNELFYIGMSVTSKLMNPAK